MLDTWMGKIKTWEKAIFSWVIGPGLGRDIYMDVFFPLLIDSLPEGSIVVIDADGIYYLCKHPELFEKLKRFKTIITPNHKELAMLEKALEIDISSTVALLAEVKSDGDVL
jgi:NAD(P)H-hydrate repair Nnr-like enzyme with NAD(P)H-hydrate dehydratase domain